MPGAGGVDTRARVASVVAESALVLGPVNASVFMKPAQDVPMPELPK